MLLRKLSWSSAVFLVLIGSLHILAVFFLLYFKYWWFDLPMHLLGGIFAGLFGMTLLALRDYSKPSPGRLLAAALFGVLLLGILWEIYEYVSGFTFAHLNYAFDTLKDLIIDCIGGLTAYYFVFSGWLNP